MSFSVVFSDNASQWDTYDESLFFDTFEVILAKYEGKLPGIVELVFVSDEEMQSFNSKYRKIDKTTDVLSFRLSDEVGQIFISIPQALKQAEGFKHSIEIESRFLFVHGILHLAGYEDDTDEKYDEMMTETERIIEQVQAK